MDAGSVLTALALGAGALAYARRWRAADDASARQATWFAAFALTVLVATAGPLYRVAETQLAVAHVVVLLLLLNAAPLMLMRALTPGLLGPRFAPLARLGSPALLAIPIVALAVVVYAWYAPPLFDAAAGRPLLAAAQHASFLAVGIGTWWSLAAPAAVRPTLHGPAALFYMAADEIIVGALGIVLTWAPRPLYSTYLEAPRSWGLSVLTDQSLSGAIILVVEELPLAVALAVFFIQMLARDEREQQERDRAELG